MKTKPQRILSALKRDISSGKIPAGSRLPALEPLRTAFGVSKITLLKALSELEDQGYVTRMPRVGVFVRGSEEDQLPALPDYSPGQTRAERLASDLKTEICLGKYRVGNLLPSPKTLQYQYRTSSRTVRKATDILQKAGLLHKRGQATIIGQGATRPPVSRRSILFISDYRGTEHVALGEKTVLAKFVDSMAATLQDLGLLIERRSTRGSRTRILPGTAVLKNVSGVVCAIPRRSFDGFTREEFGQLESFLKKMDRLSIPLVFFRNIPFPAGLLKAVRRYRRFFPAITATATPGINVGKHLALHGHQRISFFSFTQERWDKARFRQTAKSHKEVLGPQSHVIPFAADCDVRAFFRKHATQEKQPNFSRFIEKEHNGYTFQSAGKNLNPYWEARIFVRHLLYRDHLYAVMPPFFERALKSAGSTAWVCADPMVAVAAVDFLREKGVRVPEDLSLISIDDRNELVLRGITAFNYRAERLGYLAAHCLAGDLPVKRKRDGTIDCPGEIIERGSVGRV